MKHTSVETILFCTIFGSHSSLQNETVLSSTSVVARSSQLMSRSFSRSSQLMSRSFALLALLPGSGVIWEFDRSKLLPKDKLLSCSVLELILQLSKVMC